MPVYVFDLSDFFSPALLRYNRLVTLCKFKVHSVMT